MAEVEDMVRGRVMRLLHILPLAALIGLGIGPFFVLFPNLPDVPDREQGLEALEIWIGVAALAGFAGSIEGLARPLYRIGATILAASLLSLIVMWIFLRIGVPYPHILSSLLGLNGEASMDAALYELWLMAWLASLAAALLCWRFVRRRRRLRATP